MKPMGRQHFKDSSGSKHHVKIDGKEENWWDELVAPNKTFAKRKANKQIKQDIKDYYHEQD